jgi:calcineurin-like phosphoesterase family protein
MSRDIWVISDTHLGHQNILNFTDSATGNLVRGHLFDNIDQMDE